MYWTLWVAVGVLAVALGCGPEQPPSVIAFGDVHVPASAHDFYETSSGLQGTMLQARFELPEADLRLLEPSLHCVFGPPSSTPSSVAHVGTNRKSWYAPESARLHRECQGRQGRIAYEALADVSRPGTARVYLLVED